MALIEKKTPLRVFISSTSEDMMPYREAAQAAITRLGHVSVGMEYFGASHKKPLDMCLEAVRKCQLVILLVGMRYGDVDKLTGKSYTELEYEEAIINNIDVLTFMIDENKGLVAPKYVETGIGAEKLETFKSRLKFEHTIVWFASAQELERNVYQAITA
jgi:hypothetical protein